MTMLEGDAKGKFILPFLKVEGDNFNICFVYFAQKCDLTIETC